SSTSTRLFTTGAQSSLGRGMRTQFNSKLAILMERHLPATMAPLNRTRPRSRQRASKAGGWRSWQPNSSPEGRRHDEGNGNATREKHYQDCIALIRVLILLYDHGCRCGSRINGNKYFCSSIYACKVDRSSVDICAGDHRNHIRGCFYPARVF